MYFHRAIQNVNEIVAVSINVIKIDPSFEKVGFEFA